MRAPLRGRSDASPASVRAALDSLALGLTMTVVAFAVDTQITARTEPAQSTTPVGAALFAQTQRLTMFNTPTVFARLSGAAIATPSATAVRTAIATLAIG